MTVEDEIRHTLAAYVIGVDDKDVPALVDLFAADGKLIVAPDEVSGRPALTKFLTDLFSNAPAGWRTKHLLASSVIDVHGDTADVVSDVVMLQAFDETPWAINRTGRHVDRLVREDDKWRFQEKRVELNKFVLGLV